MALKASKFESLGGSETVTFELHLVHGLQISTWNVFSVTAVF